MAKRSPQTVNRPDSVATLTGDAGRRRFSLREAVLTALDPKERAELKSLEGEAYMIYAVTTPLPKGRRYLELCNKGWAQLRPRLIAGEFIATGRDPRDPLAAAWTIPADRWASATVNFETWVVQIHEIRIVEVELSTVGGLYVFRKAKLARLGVADLDLGGRSFDVLVTLAEGAKQGRSLETIESLNKAHIAANAGSRELGRVIYGVREALVKTGMSRKSAMALVQNVPNKGYRLNMPPDEIFLQE